MKSAGQLLACFTALAALGEGMRLNSRIIPKNGSVNAELASATTSGATSTIGPCDIPTDDPAFLWQNSGAEDVVNNWLAKNSTVNWLAQMDLAFTQDGGQTTTNLDCSDFPNGNCAFPDVQCRYFTPPGLYYVRNAAANLYQSVLTLYNGLSTLVADDTALRVDQVFNDFTPPTAPMFNMFPFAIGSAVIASLIPGYGQIATAVIGIFNLLAGFDTQASPAILTPTEPLSNQLANMWQNESQLIQDYIHVVFGGVMNSAMQSAWNTDSAATVINYAFEDGRWLIPNNVDANGLGPIDQEMNPILNQTKYTIMQTLAILTIKSNKFFTWVDTSLAESDCSGITGAYWDGSQCYVIGKAGKNWQETGSANNNLRGAVQYMDSDMIKKLNDPQYGYGFDMAGMYKNSDACQAKGGGNVTFIGMNPITPATGTPYPECFVNWPMIKADQTPCNDHNNDWSSLGFDSAFCYHCWQGPITDECGDVQS